MKLLITGGAGFLGSHFVRAVLADRLPGLEGASVTVLDKLGYAGSFANLGAVAEDPRLDFVPGDVADAPVVRGALRDHDAIVHFAAETSAARSRLRGESFAQTNVTGTQVLLDEALRRGTGRFVQVSTGAVYGPIPAGANPASADPDGAGLDGADPDSAGPDGADPDGAWTEDAALSPASPYAASKAGADLAALAFYRTHGLPVVVTRASDTYGPRQHPEKTIPRAVTHLLDGRTVPLAGDGPVREWLHAGDHCRAVALALLNGRAGEVYHVGGSVELADRDLIARILEACGAGWDRVVPAEPPPATEGTRQALNDDRIRRELGWRPEIEFEAGLAATIRWYRDHPRWWQPLLFD
jgi:dTDP-glucose 4,6-dehydratase